MFVSDGLIETIAPALTPGAEFHTIWGSDTVPQLPQDGTEPSHPQWFPGPGGYRVGFFTVAPANAPAPQVSDMNAALADFEAKMPGLLGHMEPGAPGMHTTDSVDYAICVSGELVMEMEDGDVTLKPGDVVIQRGTMHNWVNKGTEPCIMAFILIATEGAKTTGWNESH